MSIAKPKLFWPLVIDGTNDALVANDGSSDATVHIVHATYLSAVLLGIAVQTALNTKLPGNLVTVSADGIFHITWTGPFTLRHTGFTAASVLGFFTISDNVSIDDGTGIGNHYYIDATYQHPNGWYHSTAVQVDSLPIRMRDMNISTRTVAGQAKYIIEGENQNRTMTVAYVQPERTYIAYENGSSTLNRAFERFWQDGYARFRYWPDASVEGSSVDLQFDMDSMKVFQPVRMTKNKGLYQIPLTCWLYTP